MGLCEIYNEKMIQIWLHWSNKATLCFCDGALKDCETDQMLFWFVVCRGNLPSSEMCQGSNKLVAYLYGRIKTPLLCLPAVSTLHLFNSSLSGGRHPALASGATPSAFRKDDTFEKKNLFLEATVTTLERARGSHTSDISSCRHQTRTCASSLYDKFCWQRFLNFPPPHPLYCSNSRWGYILEGLFSLCRVTPTLRKGSTCLPLMMAAAAASIRAETSIPEHFPFLYERICTAADDPLTWQVPSSWRPSRRDALG